MWPSVGLSLSRTIHWMRLVKTDLNFNTMRILLLIWLWGRTISNVHALLDSGAGGTFIDEDFCRKYKIPTFTLKKSLSIYNVDRTLNKKGTITQVAWFMIEINGVLFIIHWYVTKLEDQQMILGLSWLHLYNPQIDWDKGTIFIDKQIKKQTTKIRQILCPQVYLKQWEVEEPLYAQRVRLEQEENVAISQGEFIS